jgi:hypothetical protein
MSVGHLTDLATWQSICIESLQARYGICFESRYGRHTSLANYAYLDLLDQAWTAAGRPVPTGGLVTDVGCANFWYARTLHRFFRPAKLTGVDVEGYRLYRTGYSRYDAAAGYVADLPQTSFVTVDYCEMDEQVDVITAWFPFVTPTPVLAWRLPLTVFSPERLFARIARNLAAGGTLFMVNQGTDEADVAAGYCRQAGASFTRLLGSSAAIAPPAPSSGRLLVDNLAEAASPHFRRDTCRLGSDLRSTFTMFTIWSSRSTSMLTRSPFTQPLTPHRHRIGHPEHPHLTVLGLEGQ